VKLGGREMPLFYAGNQQINAQVPAELTPGSTASIVVTVNGVAAAPDQVTVSSAQPGIFTLNQQGTGQGAILISNTDFFAAPAGSVPSKNARPANRGEFITVYCTGLGATTPPVPSGTQTPGSPLSRVDNAVTATIGGLEASISFAGLAPGFAALYQVDMPVPAGVTAGDAVPVIIRQGGVVSNTATIAVR